MQTATAVAFYGSQRKLARVLGISASAVNQWGELVPESRARRLDELTAGALRYEPGAYVLGDLARREQQSKTMRKHARTS